MAIRTEDERQARIRARLSLISPGRRDCVCAIPARCRAEQSARGPAVPVWDLWEPGRCPCSDPSHPSCDLYSAAGLIAAWRPDHWPAPPRPDGDG